MDFDKLPKRPVIPSQSSAIAEINEWMRSNRYDTVTDGDGLVWRLNLEAGPQLPQQARLAAGQEPTWEVKIWLEADVTGDELVATGTFDPDKDQRMLHLLESRSIPLRMRPMIYQAQGVTAARQLVADVLPKFRENIAKTELCEVKKGLVGRWLDEHSAFSKRY